MPARAELLRTARREAIEVLLLDLLNESDAITAVLNDVVPEWLRDGLADNGMQTYLEKRGAWILAPLDG